MKRAYHEFKRVLPHSEPDDPPWTTKALVKAGTAIVTIRLREEHVRQAMELKGFADGNNCAGGICTIQHKRSFDHPVMPLVDWFYRRVFICESINRKTGKAICRVYAHYDGIAQLFDGGPKGLEKLLKRVQRDGYIDITLYPAVRGLHPRTGKPTRPAGGSGPSGERRSPRPVGNDLRLLTHMRAFHDVVPPTNTN